MTANQPNSNDAILGNNTAAPVSSGILGGIDGIRQKLATADLALRIEALEQAWAYGEAGKVCLEEMLTDRSKTIRRRARWLLRQPAGTVLTPEPVWNMAERLWALGNSEHADVFAQREIQNLSVEDLRSESPIELSTDLAYAIRTEWDSEDKVVSQLMDLVKFPTIDRLEALVIGMWGDNEAVSTGDDTSAKVVETLVAMKDRLPNLKALFIGDIIYQECEISWLIQSDMSPILQAYPQLEVLQVRGGTGLSFGAGDVHENLKALIIETGGLPRKTLHEVYNWQFPALEHLEIWFGHDDYGGDCDDTDLTPILEDLKFPNLTYLGLRNAQFTHELVDRLFQSPLLAGLQVLDLSMGTLGDEDAAKLLKCEAIKDLEILNVSGSYLYGDMIEELMALGIEVFVDEQRDEEDYGDDEDDIRSRRYCSVGE
jgi:hypothetical protein